MKLKLYMKVLALIILFISSISSNENKLISVIHLIRHGIRKPMNDNKYFKDKERFKPGDLTDIGASQLYKLGRLTYENYIMFLNSKKNIKVSYLSTPLNRTLTSMRAFVNGFSSFFESKFRSRSLTKKG